MIIKTSESDPLRIDTITSKYFPGKIGMTLCPGKQQENALSGRWNRNLKLDMQQIKSYGVSTLFTLMESYELEMFGVSDIGRECKNAGIKWYHLPIVDQCAPNKSFEVKWETVSQEIQKTLLQGDFIVFHCLGGLGRTGTIAARILIEFGESNFAAVQKVRTVRPGAIEALIQEKYIESLGSADRDCKMM